MQKINKVEWHESPLRTYIPCCRPPLVPIFGTGTAKPHRPGRPRPWVYGARHGARQGARSWPAFTSAPQNGPDSAASSSSSKATSHARQPILRITTLARTEFSLCV